MSAMNPVCAALELDTEITLEEAVLLEKQAKAAKNAKAKEQLRVAYEAKTTARKCLGCGDEFRSEGPHHRMCNRCRSRR